MIPGVFVALCLKYDVHMTILRKFKDAVHEFNFEDVNTRYFKWCMVGYGLGIMATFSAMIVFDHAQPALLFLVPGCTFSVVLCALKHKEIKALFEYSEDHVKEEVQEHKEGEHATTTETEPKKVK